MKIDDDTLVTLIEIRDSDPALQWYWPDCTDPSKSADPFNWIGVQFNDATGKAIGIKISVKRNLMSLPPQIGSSLAFRRSVVELDLDRCSSLVSIPPEVGLLGDLRRIKLSRCSSLTSLPTEIGSLMILEEIDCNRCTSLMYLPDSIGTLVWLRVLNVHNCRRLRSLPAGIWSRIRRGEDDGFGQLKCTTELMDPQCQMALESLRSSDTNLRAYWKTSAPPGLGGGSAGGGGKTPSSSRRLSDTNPSNESEDYGGYNRRHPHQRRRIRRTNFDDDVNDDEDIDDASPFRDDWTGITFDDQFRIVNMNLSGCSVKYLPDEIGGLSHDLRQLDLSNSVELVELSPEIGRLVRLEELDLSDCVKLSSVPSELGGLTSLKTLKMDNCPEIQCPPKTLLGDPLRSMEFLRATHKMKTDASSVRKTLLGAPPTDPDHVVWMAFKILCNDPANANALHRAVRVDLYLMHIQTPDGLTLEQITCPECWDAAQRALLLLGRYDVRPGRPLHVSETSMVIQAYDRDASIVPSPSSNSGGGGAGSGTGGGAGGSGGSGGNNILREERVVLKLLRDPKRVHSELVARFNMDDVDIDYGDTPVMSLRGAYRDSAGTGAASTSQNSPVAGNASGGSSLRIDMNTLNTGNNESTLNEEEDLLGSYKGPITVETSEGMAADLADLLSSKLGRSRLERPFNYLLALDYAKGGTLKDAMIHEDLIGSISRITDVFGDIVKAVAKLHRNRRIHGCLDPLNIVRVSVGSGGSGGGGVGGGGHGHHHHHHHHHNAHHHNAHHHESWKLIDLSCCRRFGERWNDDGVVPTPNGRYGCPPELAALILRTTVDDDGISTSTSEDVLVGEAHDIWSLGCILFELLTGRPLVSTSGGKSGSVTRNELELLADWSPGVDGSFFLRLHDAIGEVESDLSEGMKAGLDLAKQLLDPDYSKRVSHFPKGTLGILRHPFFGTRALEESAVQEIKTGLELMDVREQERTRSSNIFKSLAFGEVSELRRLKELLMIGKFESLKMPTPTSFVVTKEKIPTEDEPVLDEGIIEISAPDADRSDADSSVGSILNKDKEVVPHKAQFEEAMTWAKCVDNMFSKEVGSKRDGEDIFVSIKKYLGDLVSDKEMYFYFIDDLTGRPVLGEGYPLTVSEPSEIVPKLFPLMLVAMHSAALTGGAVGLARMFGYDSSELPEKTKEEVRESIETLKREALVRRFGSLHDDLREVTSHSSGGEIEDSTRALSLRELLRFLEKATDSFAPLKRYPIDKSIMSNSLWTTAGEPDEFQDAISRRCAECADEELGVQVWRARDIVEIESAKKQLEEAETELEGSKKELERTRGEFKDVQNQLKSAKTSEYVNQSQNCCPTM